MILKRYKFIKNIPPVHLFEQERQKIKSSLSLAPYAEKKCLVLDLDETLVHCDTEPIGEYDLTFEIDFEGSLHTIYARKRPFCEYFLQVVSSHFEVVVFTASQRCYADKLLDILDPEKKYIQYAKRFPFPFFYGKILTIFKLPLVQGFLSFRQQHLREGLVGSSKTSLFHNDSGQLSTSFCVPR